MKKKLLIAVGAVVAVIIIAVGIVLLTVSPASYKGAIIARLRQATGREVTIAGPLSLSIFPEIGIAASDVSLANMAGSADPEMARVKKLDIAVTLIPLLSGRFEIDRFVLINPVIHLAIDAEGRPNWNFGPAAPAAAPRTQAAGNAPPPAPAGAALAALSRFSVAKMTIENGDITFADRRTGQQAELRNVDLDIALPGPGRPATLKGSAAWRGSVVTLSASLADPGAIMNAGGKTAFQLSLTAKQVTAQLAGTLAGAGTGASTLAFDGTAAIAMPSVRDFIAWSGLAITLPPRGFGALSLSGKVHGEDGIAKFTDAKLKLDDISATGMVTADLTSTRPSASATLQTGPIDLNPYLPPPSPGSGWSVQAFDLAPLRQVDVDFNLTTQGIRYRKIAIGNSDFALHLKASQLVLDLNRIALYQGLVKGQVRLDVTKPAARLAADLSMAGVALKPFLQDAAGIDRIGGSGAGNLEVTATGDSQRDLIASLAGKGAFRIAHAAVGGVDLTRMLRNSAGAFNGGGNTAISDASGHFTIARGVMDNPDLTASMSGFDVTGAGTIDLPARTVNYRVTPKLVAGIVTVPVIVSGPWDDLSYRPDLAGIAKGLVETPGRAVEGAAGLGKNVGEGVGNGIGSALKGLFDH